jgi:hypothetical protein
MALAVAYWSAWPQQASAHCDGVDGPVAVAARQALETGNVNLALPYAPASAEEEIVARFAQARAVRASGGEAQELADRAFMETVVRLHRVGEGAEFTGLQPAGVDYGPVVPAAEQALETRDLSELRAILIADIDRELAERLAHAKELEGATLEPSNHDQVSAARERINAELAFVLYAEGLRQAIASSAQHVE